MNGLLVPQFPLIAASRHTRGETASDTELRVSDGMMPDRPLFSQAGTRWIPSPDPLCSMRDGVDGASAQFADVYWGCRAVSGH